MSDAQASGLSRWALVAPMFTCTGTMVLGVVIHSDEGLIPSVGPYALAIALLVATSGLGALACALLLRE